MSVIYYAIEVDTETSLTDASVGMTQGFIRFTTGRPSYTGTDTGAAVIPTGDNSVLKLAVTDNTESLETALTSGELFTPANGIFKSADTILNNGDRFTLTATGDFTGNDLETAKGSATAEGDMFEVTNNGEDGEAETVSYVGINKYYEDFITKNGMSNPSRRIDLEMTGDYGTLSGFNFQINQSMVAGSTTPFWKTIFESDIFFANKKVRVYTVIDDVFYQIWSGIVDNNPRNETDYKFVCKSNYKAVHKNLPPNTFDAITYPNTIDDVKDEAIPVCLGDIEYAKCFNINGNPEWETLVRVNGFSSDSAHSTYYVIGASSVQFDLRTEGVTFAGDDLKDKYLFVESGGGSPDTDRGIRILSNGPTDINGDTNMSLEEPIAGFTQGGPTPTTFIYGYNYGTVTDRWNFKIGSVSQKSVVSNSKISKFKENEDSLKILTSYDSNLKKYDDITNIISSFDVEDTDSYDNATISTLTPNISKDGDFELGFPIPIEDLSLKFLGYYVGSEYPEKLTDFDRSTYIEKRATVTIQTLPCIMDATFSIPINESNIDFDSIYVGADITEDGSDAGMQQNFYMDMTFYNQYGDAITGELVFRYPNTDPSTSKAYTNFNILPNSYYRGNPGGDNSEASAFAIDDGNTSNPANQKVPISSGVMIPSTLYSRIKGGSLQNKVKLRVTITPDKVGTPGTDQYNFRFKQIGIFGIKPVDVTGNNLYTRISGELLSGGTTESNTVYKAFRRILEDYDGLSASEIDYGNLSTYRDDWYVGKQITERKNSFEYLKELASNSFVGIFQNRKGKTALSAWRDRTDTPHQHDEDSIIRDSISSFKLTGIDKVYNNFNALFSYNPGGNKYFSQYPIKDIEGDTAPAGIGILEPLWDVCHAAYAYYKVIKEFKINLSWFNDRTRWYNSTDTGKVGLGIDSPAYKFLYNACTWLTRQKRDATYKIPMNTDNVLCELCDPVNFRDTIYTDGAADTSYQSGHIYLIEYDLKNDNIKIGSIIEPEDNLDDDYGDIIETGSAGDTITETGSASDTITEGA